MFNFHLPRVPPPPPSTQTHVALVMLWVGHTMSSEIYLRSSCEVFAIFCPLWAKIGTYLQNFSLRRFNISQMKHQLDATLCRFYFCRVTLHVSGASAHHLEYLKLVQRPLVYVLSLQVSNHISLLGHPALIRRCDAGSLYMFRAQAPIIRSI